MSEFIVIVYLKVQADSRDVAESDAEALLTQALPEQDWDINDVTTEKDIWGY